MGLGEGTSVKGDHFEEGDGLVDENGFGEGYMLREGYGFGEEMVWRRDGLGS